MSKTDGRTRPFADFLAEHNQGVGHRQAGEALQRLVAAVQDTGKKGSITIRVDVAQMKDDETLLVTTVAVTEKLPVSSPKPAIFYADDENNLVRTDPRQMTFEGLKEVPAPTLKDAPAAPAVAAGDA